MSDIIQQVDYDNAIQEIVLSYSTLKAYRDCPFRSKHEKVSGGVPAIRGNCFHDSIALYYMTRDFPAAVAFAKAFAIDNGLTATDMADVIGWMTTIVNSRRYQWPREKVIAVESNDGETVHRDKTMFKVKLPVIVDGKRLFLRGMMDVVLDMADRGIEVDDWKTGFLDADQFQAEFYALAAHLKYWRTLPISVRFIYVARGFSPMPVVYDGDDMAGILEYITVLATLYARETEWKPRLNPNCKDCSLKMGCDEHLKAIAKAPEKLEVDPSDIHAIMRWRKHLSIVKGAAEKLYESMTAMAKAHLTANGNKVLAEDPGSDITLTEQISGYSYPFESVKGILDANGVDWKKAASFSTGDIETAINAATMAQTITQEAAEALLTKINGKKAKDGTWEVEPIRQVSGTKSVIGTKKQKQTK